MNRNWALINIGWNKNKWNKMEIKDIKWNIWISKTSDKWNYWKFEKILEKMKREVGEEKK